MKDQFLAGRLYVGSLNHSTTKDDVEREFGKYGHLVDIWMARNPPGFAFVEFETAGQAEAALKELNGRNFLGNRIMVEPSRAQNGRGGRGGGSGGGGRGGGGGGGGGRYDSRRDGDRGRTGGPPRSPRGQYRDYPPSDYGRSSDFSRGGGGDFSRGGDFGRGGGSSYRDESRGSRYGDSYSSYAETAYRSRSPIRRRSPAFAAPPPSRGRDYGGRDYGGGRDIGSRDAGSRDYTRREPRRDYEREPRDYASAPSASYGGGRPERSPYENRGSDRGYERGGFDQGGYDRPSRRSPPPRR